MSDAIEESFKYSRTGLSEISLLHVLSQRRTVRNYSDVPIPLDVLKKLLWAGQGVTGPDGKRTSPSAHALHPLKLYFQVNRVVGLEKGLYELNPSDDHLKQVSDLDLRRALTDAAIGRPQWIMDAACIIIICADMATPGQAFADQKPFGSRGARYVYLEAGAVAQNLQLQAVADGLGSVWVGGFDDEATANALGLRAPFSPIIQLCVGYPAPT